MKEGVCKDVSPTEITGLDKLDFKTCYCNKDNCNNAAATARDGASVAVVVGIAVAVAGLYKVF